MKIILDIATILGGITALWFIWDKFLIFWNARKRKESPEKPSSTPKQQTQPLLNREQVPTIVFCALSGVCLGIIGGRYGYEAIMVSAIVGIIPGFIGGKLFEWDRYESIHTVLLFGGVFIFFWGMIAGLIAIIIEVVSGIRFIGITAGILLTITGGIVGVISGARITNYAS